jgi:hypothetical protein
MTPKPGQFINKTVLVAIPAVFGDITCRPHTLLGFELQGLWLHSDELNQRLLGEDAQNISAASLVAFVPFTQIAGVVIPTAPLGPPPPGAPGGPDPKPAAAPAKTTARRPRRQASQRRPGPARGSGGRGPGDPSG